MIKRFKKAYELETGKTLNKLTKTEIDHFVHMFLEQLIMYKYLQFEYITIANRFSLIHVDLVKAEFTQLGRIQLRVLLIDLKKIRF
jgi:hypothetical protein